MRYGSLNSKNEVIIYLQMASAMYYVKDAVSFQESLLDYRNKENIFRWNTKCNTFVEMPILKMFP